jgi:hypothetical protein
MTDFFPAAPNFRALCEELCFIWSRSTNPDDLFENLISFIPRARAALATPPPKRPTVMEIIALGEEIEKAGLGNVDLVRAALERWGNQTTITQTHNN